MNIRINIKLIEILLQKNDLFVDLTTALVNKISKSIIHVMEKINFKTIFKEINRINQKGIQQDAKSKFNQCIICPSWIFAQKKVFILVVLILLYQRIVEGQNTYNHTYIEDEEFIIDVNKYFPAQPLDFIAYQLREFQEKEKNRMWSFEQQQLLRIIVQQLYHDKTEINWKTIAYSLFLKSQRKFYRNFHQIRQKWLNYFDPSIRKGKWAPQQDLQLLQSIQRWGKRWSKISREIGKSRTQHMVKNRFNSLLKKNRESISSLGEWQTIQFLLQNTKNELIGFTQPHNKNNINIQQTNNVKQMKKITISKSRKPRSKVKQAMICQSMILTDLESKSSFNGVGYEKFREDNSQSEQIKIDWSLQDNNLFFRTQLFPESFQEVLNFQYHRDFHEEIDEN